MGKIVEISGKPDPISVQLPGGAKVGSMASATQQAPNSMDPFQSVIQGVQPSLASVQPVFDVIGFAMALTDSQMLQLKVLGSLMNMFAPDNPFSKMFTVDPVLDENDEPVLLIPKIEVAGVTIFEGGPEIPDFPKIVPDLIESQIKVLGAFLKIVGLIPQLSMVASIKDIILTAMSFSDAAMAQVNSLTDLFTGIPAADTGKSEIDAILTGASDNTGPQLEHKLGPVGNLAPLMSIVSKQAEIAKVPLPSVILTAAELLANKTDADPPGFGVIPFPDLSSVGGPDPDEQREQFLGLIEDLTIQGLPFEIPSFDDVSKLGDILKDLQERVKPLAPIIELLQEIFDKLTSV